MPAQLSSLIGRERDLQEIGAMLSCTRLLRFREADEAYGRAVAASDPTPALRARDRHGAARARDADTATQDSGDIVINGP